MWTSAHWDILSFARLMPFQTNMKDMEIILIYIGDPRRQEEKWQYQETKRSQVMCSEINLA